MQFTLNDNLALRHWDEGWYESVVESELSI